MADNRPDARVSMRTMRSRVSGLGAAHHGVEHWYQHRLSAVANIPLVIAFVIIVANLAGRPFRSRQELPRGRHRAESK